MKLMITGGTGFIGQHLVSYWKQCQYSITVVARQVKAGLSEENVQFVALDITCQNDIQAAIIALQPDVVIHTAALSKPNDCEANKAECYATNVAATVYVATACKATGAKLIFLSTDFVFGNNGPYSESDACEPVNYYGESKRLAEEVIRTAGIQHAIVRTGLVVGPKLHGQANTFLHWIRENLEAGKPIQLYTDQRRSPTFVTDLCKGIDKIITADFSGTIHLSGSEVFSPFSLAQQVAPYLQLNPKLLLPVTSTQRPEPAVRPQNAVLNIEKARLLLGYTTTPINEILEAVFKQ